MGIVTLPEARRAPGAHARRSALHPRLIEAAAHATVVVPPLVVLILLGPTLTEPLWFNEQWRASFFSHLGGWMQGLQADHMTSMATGWYFLERWTGQIFGSTELALRIPTAAFLVIDCVLLMHLARRWLPLPVACAVALVAGLTTDLVNYAVQLSPYAIDTATIVAVLLLIESMPVHRRRALLHYAGVGVACFFGSATVFVAAPVLAVDALRALRSKTWWRLGGIAGAAALAVVNLAVQLGENNGAEYRYWATGYPPHHNALTFYWTALRSFVENGLTDGRSFGPSAHGAVVAVWVVLIAAGVFTVIWRRIAGNLLVAIVGSLALTMLTSALRIWPFGYVRTNTYEVPLLVLLASIGAVGIWKSLTRARVAVVLVGVGAASLVALYEGAGIQAMTVGQPPGRYGDGVRAAVATVRHEARPGAAVVEAGNMAATGWRYYLFDYAGSAVNTGRRIPRSRVLLVTTPMSREETTFLKRTHPPEVFLYFPWGTPTAQINTVVGRFRQGGYCHPTKAIWSFSVSGQLLGFNRC